MLHCCYSIIKTKIQDTWMRWEKHWTFLRVDFERRFCDISSGPPQGLISSTTVPVRLPLSVLYISRSILFWQQHKWQKKDSPSLWGSALFLSESRQLQHTYHVYFFSFSKVCRWWLQYKYSLLQTTIEKFDPTRNIPWMMVYLEIMCSCRYTGCNGNDIYVYIYI